MELTGSPIPLHWSVFSGLRDTAGRFLADASPSVHV